MRALIKVVVMEKNKVIFMKYQRQNIFDRMNVLMQEVRKRKGIKNDSQISHRAWDSEWFYSLTYDIGAGPVWGETDEFTFKHVDFEVFGKLVLINNCL